mmetsp:Transcript_774/g.4814  ORF Transcript_774/g.4814 Transcript_774/m.4814 type:complete len:124 (+) Transcript_774:631-1002(+)
MFVPPAAKFVLPPTWHLICAPLLRLVFDRIPEEKAAKQAFSVTESLHEVYHEGGKALSARLIWQSTGVPNYALFQKENEGAPASILLRSLSAAAFKAKAEIPGNGGYLLIGPYSETHPNVPLH